MHETNSPLSPEILKFGSYDMDENLFFLNSPVYYMKDQAMEIIGHREFSHGGRISHNSLDFTYGQEQIWRQKFRDVNYFSNDGAQVLRNDVEEVFTGEHFGKSFPAFIDDLLNGRFCNINTARGHSSQTLAGVVHMVGDIWLTTEQKKYQAEAIRENFQLGKDTPDNMLFNLYYYHYLLHYGINDPAFLNTVGLEALDNSHNKTVAFDFQLAHVRRKISAIMGYPHDAYQGKIDVAFSDDDFKHIKVMHAHMTELQGSSNLQASLYYSGKDEFYPDIINLQNDTDRLTRETTEYGDLLKIKL